MPHSDGAERVTSGGSRQTVEVGHDAMPCDRHGGLHDIVTTTAGFTYLACGCRLLGELTP